MEFVVSLLYFVLFCLVIARLPFFRAVPGLSTQLLLFLFALKVVAGSILTLVYTYYYDINYADIYKYYFDGRVLYSALAENPLDYLRMLTGIDASAPHLCEYYDKMKYWTRPWGSPLYNDTRLVIRFNALVSVFSMGFIHVHGVFINLLSFAGLVALYKFLTRYTDPAKLHWLPWGVFLFPSLLFWGSGLLKESLLLFAFGYWVYFMDGLVTKRLKKGSIPWFLFFSLLLVLLKPYTIVIWIPCMVAFYWGMHKRPLQVQTRYLGIFVLISFLVLVLGWLFPSYSLLDIIIRKQHDFVNHSIAMEATSLMHTRYLDDNLWNIAVEFLMGLFYALMRPHLLEVYSIFTLMAALENLLVLGMVVYLAFYWDKAKAGRYPVLWLSLWFAFLLMGFVGMLSPAHGGIVRYKIPALPFLWVAFIHLAELPGVEKFRQWAGKMGKNF